MHFFEGGWTVVNERDELGDELVPDYMTAVKDGGFYGWPYSYFGQHVDVRVKPPRPDLVALAIEPDYVLGSDTASPGLAAPSQGTCLPARYAQGMFTAYGATRSTVATRSFLSLLRMASLLACRWTGKATLLVAGKVGNVVWRISLAR